MVEEFIQKKSEEKTQDIHKWGNLFKAISDNEEVMQFGWKYNSLCLFQSTVHTGDEVQVVQPRKKPSLTLSKAKTAQQSFGNNVLKCLSIPWIVDEYNHNMNYFDWADHLWANYEIIRDHRLQKGWKVCFSDCSICQWSTLIFYLFTPTMISNLPIRNFFANCYF